MRTVKRISAVILCAALLLAVLTVCVGCRKKTDVRMKIECCEIQNGRRVLPFVDEVIFERDVETYGLFTYEEFRETFDVPEEIFEAFNGRYLKVAIGKGLTDEASLLRLIERYSLLWNGENV